MERRAARWNVRAAVIVGAVTVVLWLTRHVLWALMMQLLGGYVLMAMALPLCRVLEKRMSPGWAAALSFLALGLVAVAVLVGLIPPLVQQFRQVSAMFPAWLGWLEQRLAQGQSFLQERGVNLSPVRDEFFSTVSRYAGNAVSVLAGTAAQTVRTMSKLVLSPLIGFYLLRDRRQIASLLMLLLPVSWRARAVRAGREMRRETACFLRGQLLVSAFVGTLTAVGLMLIGTPGWLLLGLLMGVMELVPYIGPVLAGIPAVLMALQSGWTQALWTLLVLWTVQQVEGSFLSPRLLSGATRLHPLTVLLAISAGGIFSGTLGMLLALPIVVSVRGAMRGLRR